MKRLALLVAVAAMATACKVGPDYEKPAPLPNDQPISDQWYTAATMGLASADSNIQTWWTVFNDRKLQELIERAQIENLDLRVAVARIREARAGVGVARGERMPVLDAAGDLSIGKSSEAAAPISPEEGFETAGLLSLGVDARWEMDVFGKFARNIEAAEASYEATVEDYRDVLVSLLAEVALAYVDLRALQQRIDFARSNIEAQRESLQLTRDRFDAGLTSALDVAQAESNLGDTESTRPEARAKLEFRPQRSRRLTRGNTGVTS